MKHMDNCYDVAVIGGGINGCGIAADAATRGLSVLLIEKDDLASKTSSSSSKLIHGGLRYLEQYDFKLVKKALRERELLLSLAPHLIYPQPFVLALDSTTRPAWMLKAGLFIYDHLNNKNSLPYTKAIDRLHDNTFFHVLNDTHNQGFLFYDCATDDARLTITNAKQAAHYGAKILTQTELLTATPLNDLWKIAVKSSKLGFQEFSSRVLINATGPWTNITNQRLNLPDRFKLSLIKGSHIVVKKLYAGHHAYLLQNHDKRVIFVIPYQDHTLIGTTDIVYTDNLDNISISNSEIDYLLTAVNRYLAHPITHEAIVTTWSGVRPLISTDDESELPQQLSRDYLINFDQNPAPVLTIYGGKITTYRQLSSYAVDQLNVIFPNLCNSMTATLPLPGGKQYFDYRERALIEYKWLNKSILNRLLQSYGTDCQFILAGSKSYSDLGIHFDVGLYQSEVDYLIKKEWAKTVDDILWRRTKLGFVFRESKKKLLNDYLICALNS